MCQLPASLFAKHPEDKTDWTISKELHSLLLRSFSKRERKKIDQQNNCAYGLHDCILEKSVRVEQG